MRVGRQVADYLSKKPLANWRYDQTEPNLLCRYSIRKRLSNAVSGDGSDDKVGKAVLQSYEQVQHCRLKWVICKGDRCCLNGMKELR